MQNYKYKRSSRRSMDSHIKGDILGILKTAVVAVHEKDSKTLREISDHTVHNASIYQDKDSITIAVVMYALSKIVERMARIEPDIERQLGQAKGALERDDFEGYEGAVKDIVDTISGFDSKLNLYIQKVIDEAQIKKGSRLYEHGISMAQTAELLGVSQWELMKYLGNTKIADKFDDEIEVSQRLDHARQIFGLK
jgi:hypothetical protein